MREKVILLVPLAFNDGTQIPQDTLDRIFQDIFVEDTALPERVPVPIGCATAQSRWKKRWVWAALETAEIPKLAELVKRFCAELDQECIWFERTGATVDFLGPDSPDGGSDG